MGRERTDLTPQRGIIMRIDFGSVRRFCVLSALLAAGFTSIALAGDRVPAERWMRYAEVEEAGFDAARLEAARKTWEGLPSSAFMVIADGAVVASWGDVERRFMCHSVRKSFLSALYGIYWDRREIDLNKTMADLGIDDGPSPLLEVEKQARILDLLKARSGIFHPAAYAGRTDSQPRGSQGPGRYFAYNNWDFNTLATILEQETGDRVFEAFDQHFGRPLGMEDWRVSDGYYHYERDKSKYPAYPFRMSARDAARFGLLFTRMGQWGDKEILSEHWVRRSSALYSIDNDVMGYGFMWWVLRDPRLARHGMFAALGVGNQMIAALPKSDLVIVNRANTYQGERTPTRALLNLIAEVLEARTGQPVEAPRLAPLENQADPKITSVSSDRLREYEGEWDLPPASLGMPPRTTLKVRVTGDHLESYNPFAGTFRLYLQPDGSLHSEDRRDRFVPVRDGGGGLEGLVDVRSLTRAAVLAAGDGALDRGRSLLAPLAGDQSRRVALARSLVELFRNKPDRAEAGVRALLERTEPETVEADVNAIGYAFLQTRRIKPALKIFELNTRVFPQAFNAWDSLGEAHMKLGNKEDAIRAYERSLELNEKNTNAKAMIARIKRSGQ